MRVLTELIDRWCRSGCSFDRIWWNSSGLRNEVDERLKKVRYLSRQEEGRSVFKN